MRAISSCFAVVSGAAVVVAVGAAQVAVLRAVTPSLPRYSEGGPRPVVVVLPQTVIQAVAPALSPPEAAPAAPAAPSVPPAPPDGVPFATTPWIGVAVSPDRSDVVAAWTKDELRVSRDGGGSFELVLPFAVRAAAVGSNGTVYASLEDCRLAVADRKGGARIVEGTYCEVQHLEARGGRLVAVSTSYPDRTTIQVSSDGGESWEVLDPPEGRELPWGIDDVALDASGRVDLAGQHYKGGECGAAYDFRWRISRAGALEAGPAWPGHIYDSPMLLGLDGWVYTTCDAVDIDPGAGCVVDPDGELHVLTDLSLSNHSSVLRGRRAAYLFEETRIYRAARKQVTLVGRDSQLDFAPRAIDAEERVYGLLAGNVVSWSPAGWRLHLGSIGGADED